ncbi:MAG TPA: potassium channel family protein [Candidatus Dormibacteraeota bacterium]|nr:potassium channel family protein [Candidatus Dormibacteraeota bacterium]
MGAVEAGGGALLVVGVLLDLFQSIVTPRPVGGRLRLSRYVNQALWGGVRRLALHGRVARHRETLLGSYGPASVLIQFLGWSLLLVVGYGLILDALRGQITPRPGGLGTSIYFAAISFYTIGYGDYAPSGPAARAVATISGATGLGVIALVITYLFSLFAAFQRREAAVVALEAAAGAPPSGVTLLETYALGGILHDLPDVFKRWQRWSAEVLDSHLAFPTLTYFRSSHDNDSWIGSLGAVMDAATLLLTTLDCEDDPGLTAARGWAKQALWVAGHCVEDLVLYFDLEAEDHAGVELDEYRAARERLARAGYRLQAETAGWEAFQLVRAGYADRINALAHHWAIPPAQWIGDRSLLKLHRRHQRG